jgi:hypothetical protein
MRDAARQQHEFHGFAHLPWHHKGAQATRECNMTRIDGIQVAGGRTELTLDTGAQKKSGLRRESCDLESARLRRRGDGREINPSRDIAKPGVYERISERVMPVMAAQTALHAIGVEQLPSRQAVIRNQDCTAVDGIR